MRRPSAPAVLVAAAIAIIGLSYALPSAAAPTPVFSADFAQPGALATAFDFGYSGQNPWAWGNGSGEGAITSFHGDHNMQCEAPTTDRTVTFGGNRASLDYSALFWQCAPGGDPAKGHLMTGVDTVGYNIAWFAPKVTFTDVSKVCWDQNLTTMSHRKWTHVAFVTPSDATKYRAGTITSDGLSQARGSGGFDLGFTEPGFRDTTGPTTGVIPSGPNAGLKVVDGGAQWWQDDQFTGPSWGDIIGRGYDGYSRFPRIDDKAARYTICVENVGADQVAISMGDPSGAPRTALAEGHIPSGPVRVVFGDDNYNPEKGEAYASDRLTWHWDNVQVFAGSSSSSTTTTAAPTTTSSSTTTSTRPPSSTTTSTAPPSTTTTTEPATTTTTAPADLCVPVESLGVRVCPL